MSEHPMIFSGESVRAILGNRKTQTRRVVKWPIQSQSDGSKRRLFLERDADEVNQLLASPRHAHPCNRLGPSSTRPGDTIWVKEQFSFRDGTDSHPSDLPVWYWADGPVPFGNWTRPGSPIYMPRSASRLSLRVVSVRVERLQDISEADALAEGVGSPITRDCKVPKFAAAWDSINAKRGHPWASNPWVWRVEFEREKQ